MKRRVVALGIAFLLLLGNLLGYVGSGVAVASEAKESSEMTYLAHYPLKEDVLDYANEEHASLLGQGANFDNGYLYLPGGSSSSNAGHVQLPTGLFDGEDEITVSMWLKNETGKGNYSAFYIGTGKNGSFPTWYYLLNPSNLDGRLKAVMTNSENVSAPYNTEYGISPTTANQGVAGPTTDSEWNLYTTVIRKDSIEAYYNLDSYGPVTVSKTLSDFGTGLLSFIGKSSYSDIFYKGGVKELRIYKGALTEEEISEVYYEELMEMAKEVIAIDTDIVVTDDLKLQTKLTVGKEVAEVEWTTSDDSIIATTGIVYRGEEEQQVTLTARIVVGDLVEEVVFDLVVAGIDETIALEEAYEALEIVAITGEDLVLPTTGKHGASIRWNSSDESIMTSNGQIVNRPSIGEGNWGITMTATITYKEQSKQKEFEVTIMEEYYGYVASYARGNNDLTGSLHLAVSKDGKEFSALNSNSGILFPKIEKTNMNKNLTTGIRFTAPSIFRQEDGTFGLIAYQGDSKTLGYVYDSKDLISYENGTLITLSEKQQEDYPTSDLTGVTMPEGAVGGVILGVTKSEYETLVAKFTRVTNTGIETLQTVTTESAVTLAEDLPSTVEVSYSDGTTGNHTIDWNLDQYDLEEAGTYIIEGTVSATEYKNPLVEQRADPQIVFDAKRNCYYMTGSYPAYNNVNNGYDRIVLRKADTIEGLSEAEEITIWNAPTTGLMAKHVWAPEIHEVNGVWYVFFAAGNSDAIWSIRPYVLVCQGDDPFDVANWKREDGSAEIHAATSEESVYFKQMSLDMTYFEHNGRHFVIWADIIGCSSMYMQEINPYKPWEGVGKVIELTSPEYAWERDTEIVNEGATILKSEDRIFITFSGSGTGPEYCIGLLYADIDADLMDLDSWTKVGYPLLTSADVPGEYGPGHNSFTVDENGEPIFVYHARSAECYNNQCAWASSNSLYDPCRHARVKRVHWSEDGFPILNTEELASENKKIQVEVVIEEDSNQEELSTPILEYTFEEALEESQGTLHGGASYEMDEEMGQVLFLDGVDGYLEFPQGVFDGKEEVTISMDVNAVTRNGNFFTFTIGQNNQKYLFLKTLPQSMRLSITKESYSNEQTASATFDNYNNSRRWINVTMVIGKTSIAIYQDGVLLKETKTTIGLEDLGTELIAYLGKSLYSGDKYFKGYFDNVKVYDTAMTAKEVRRQYQKVQQEKAELEGSISYVSDVVTIPNMDDIRGNVTLPSMKNGVSITWSSSNETVISTAEGMNANYDNTPAGVVTRQEVDTNVVLTAVFSKEGQESITKTYEVLVIAAPEEISDEEYVGYLFTHFTGHEESKKSEQVYFSISSDGLNWEALNDGAPVLTSELGEEGVRDHYVLRSPEGDKFYMIATDLSIYSNKVWMEAGANGSQGIIVWESTDLVNWSEPRLELLAADNAGCTWAPEIIYDELTGEYIVYWSSTTLDTDTNGNVTQEYENHKIYYAKTRDFHTFTEASVYHEGGVDASGKVIKVIDSTMIQDGDTYYRYTKNETEGIIKIDQSNSVLGEFTSISSTFLDNLKSSVGAVEGPIIFKLNEKDDNGNDQWCLMLDRYATGKGYYPVITTDLSSGEFTELEESEFTMPGVSRHGYVMAITASEYRALQQKWNEDYVEPTTTPEPTVAPTATPEPTVAPTVAPTVTPEPTVAPTSTPDVSINVGTVTNVKSTSYKTHIKLKWSKVQDATAYEVYRYHNTKKGYVKVATVTNTSYMDEKITQGKAYQYKIRALKVVEKEFYYGEMSNTEKVIAKPTPPKRVAAKRLTQLTTKTKASISFQENSKATSYEICQYNKTKATYEVAYQVKNGKLYEFNKKTSSYKYVRKVTVNKGVVTCTLKGLNLKKEKSMKFVIRSVVEKSGYETVRSGKSKAVIIK